MIVLATMLAGSGSCAAGDQSGAMDSQQSLQRSRAAVQNQAAQTQAAQAQQRAETAAAAGGVGVQVLPPGQPPPTAPFYTPNTPIRCLTRYTGAYVFMDCR
jgi:hypothetical protein